MTFIYLTHLLIFVLGIVNHKPLNHVEAVHDTSAPQIEPDVKVKKNVCYLLPFNIAHTLTNLDLISTFLHNFIN